MYVIKRIEDGAYVAPPGSPASYTFVLSRAATFRTVEAAQRECCENEHPVAVADLMQPPKG